MSNSLQFFIAVGLAALASAAVLTVIFRVTQGEQALDAVEQRAIGVGVPLTAATVAQLVTGWGGLETIAALWLIYAVCGLVYKAAMLGWRDSLAERRRRRAERGARTGNGDSSAHIGVGAGDRASDGGYSAGDRQGD